MMISLLVNRLCACLPSLVSELDTVTTHHDSCAQMRRDVRFLEEHNLMDYSLFVGIHKRSSSSLHSMEANGVSVSSGKAQCSYSVCVRRRLLFKNEKRGKSRACVSSYRLQKKCLCQRMNACICVLMHLHAVCKNGLCWLLISSLWMPPTMSKGLCILVIMQAHALIKCNGIDSYCRVAFTGARGQGAYYVLSSPHS